MEDRAVLFAGVLIALLGLPPALLAQERANLLEFRKGEILSFPAHPEPPAALGTGGRPGAGIQIGPQMPHFSSQVAGLELADDPARSIVWLICEPTPLPGPPLIWPLIRTSLTLAPFPPPLQTEELDGGGPPGPDIDGPGNGLALLPSGNLLCTDYNGDLNRFDDTVFELNPSAGGSTVALVSFWYLDSATTICPVSCRPNTNANVPQQRIDTVLGVDTTDGGIGGPGPIFLASQQGFYGISEVTLTPGTPGTWILARRHEPPTGGAVLTLDYDPDQSAAHGLPNAYWMTGDTGTGVVWETTFTPSSGFSTNQCFPSPAVALPARIADSVAGLRGTGSPHQLAAWRATNLAASPAGARLDAGTGPVAQTYPMEGDLFFSLLADSPRGGGLWERSGGVLDEEISLWNAGQPNARSHTTRDTLQVLFPPGTVPQVSTFDIDAISVDPGFGGTDPSIHEFLLSVAVDINMGNPRVLVDNADVFRILPKGNIDNLLTRVQIQGAVGTDDINIDVDAIEIWDDVLIVSFATGVVLTGSNPNLQTTLRAADVLHLNRNPNSAKLLWSRDELVASAANAGHTLGTNVMNVAIDPLGNPSRPNPHPGGTTRPDILFSDELGGGTSHIFSTRAGGVIARHRLTYGFGNVIGVAPVIPDALASLPGATYSPTLDLTNTFLNVGSPHNEVSLFARNIGRGATGYWGIGLNRIIPAVDLRPTLRHNPLYVLPDAVLPFTAGANGNAELNLQVPQLGSTLNVYVQGITLGPPLQALTPPGWATLR